MQKEPQAIQGPSDENPPPEKTDWTKPSRTRVIVNLALFLVSLAASVWLVSELFIAPMQAPRIVAYMLLLLPAAVAFNRLLALVQGFVAPKWMRLGLGLVKWLGTLLFPLILPGEIESTIQRQILDIVQRDMRPLIVAIETHKDQYNAFPTDIADALTQARCEQVTNLTYRAGESAYLLTIRVATADIDGAVIFYDPLQKSWHRFHNDINTVYRTYTEADNPEQYDDRFKHIRRFAKLDGAMLAGKSYLRKYGENAWRTVN
ncbi:MAG: hypothetical protein GY697_11005 [Desulfobacterales bacterium]|nr:hypothetical protein [Desulfobacterales bacterium]